MSDIGETFKALNEYQKQKRNNNKKSSKIILEKWGLNFESKNDGNHLIIKFMGKTADFWPSTGKYCIRGSKYKRGVKNLIQDLMCDKE